MDRSAMPWRVLESPPSEPTSPTTPASPRQPAEAGGAMFGRLTLPAALIAVVAFVLVAAVLLVALLRGPGNESAGISIDRTHPAATGLPMAASPAASRGEMVVAITGAVLRPGVYRIAPGSRVADGIEAAGGYAPDVDARTVGAELNLAAPLSDGEQIVVPGRNDLVATNGVTGGSEPRGSTSPVSSVAGGDSSPAAAPLDLNTATSSQLDTLPGIGPATAAKIIAAREEAAFTSVDDLRSRKLVTTTTFAKIKDLVTVH